MAVTIGSTGITGVSGAAVSTLSTGSINASAGTDQCLVVGVVSSDDPNQTPTGVTWDVGTPQNFTSQVSVAQGGFFDASLWTLVGITQATDTATATWATAVDDACIYIAEFEGVDQTTPVGNTQTSTAASSTSSSITLTGTTSEKMCVDVIGVDHSDGGGSGTTETPGANQTDLFAEVVSTGSFPMGMSGSYQDGADGGVMSWTISSANNIVHVGLVLNEAVTLTIEQEGFRIRNDDGSETTATWIAAQDTNTNVEQGALFRIRFLINATGDPASTQYTIEIKEDSESEWIEVPLE